MLSNLSIRVRRYLLSAGATLIALWGCSWFSGLPQAQAQGTGSTLADLQKQYQLAKANSATLYAQVSQYNQESQSLSAQLYQTSRQLQSRLRTAALAEAVWTEWQARARRDALAAKQAIHREQLALQQLRQQLRAWYEVGSVPYLAVFFGVHSFSDLLFRATAMGDLLNRQKQLLYEDEQLLVRARELATVARSDVGQAHSAYREAAAASAQVASQQLSEQRLFAKATQQARLSAHARTSQLAAMQRLASQISAVEVAQARAAAAAQAAARAAAQAQGGAGKGSGGGVSVAPPPAPGVLGNAVLRQDLQTAATDVGVGTTWISWMLLLVQYESSGNPAAVSPVAVSGEHASGLLQMLPDTFTRYALLGHTDIWNPVDNAIAAMRYIQANYGAPWLIPGVGSATTYHGY